MGRGHSSRTPRPLPARRGPFAICNTVPVSAADQRPAPQPANLAKTPHLKAFRRTCEMLPQVSGHGQYFYFRHEISNGRLINKKQRTLWVVRTININATSRLLSCAFSCKGVVQVLYNRTNSGKYDRSSPRLGTNSRKPLPETFQGSANLARKPPNTVETPLLDRHWQRKPAASH